MQWLVNHRMNLLTSLGGRYDLLKIFQTYVLSLQKEVGNDPDRKYLFKVGKLKEEGRGLSGILQLGDYGQEADIIHVKGLNLIHRQKVDEARLMPYYFLLAVPRGVDEAIFISQRSGVHGVHGVFLDAFKQWFNERHQEFRLHVGALITNSFLERVYKAPEVRSIHLVRYGIFEDDPADGLLAPHKEKFSSSSMQVKITAGRNESFPRKLTNTIKNLLQKQQEDSTLVSISLGDDDEKNTAAHRRERKQKFEEIGQELRNGKIKLPFPIHEANQIKVEVLLNGKPKVIGLDNSGSLRPYWDISDKVKESTNGHILFDEIDLVAKELLLEVQQGAGYEVT